MATRVIATAMNRPVHPSWARTKIWTGTKILVGIFGIALPVMHRLDLAGGQVNACAADLLLLPLLLALRRFWISAGSLGYWIFGLWMLNVISWVFSLSVLTVDVFIRESIKLATCYLYALAGYAIGRETAIRRTFIRGLASTALVMAAVGIFAFFTGVPRSFIPESRVAGTMGDPNAFGIYLGMVLPLTGSLHVAWLAIPLFIGAGVVSFSRTGLTSIFFSLLLSTLHLGIKRYLLVVLGCLIVFVSVWGIASNTTVGKRVANYHGSLEERQGLWSLAAEVAAEHPLLGIGKGNWDAISGRRTLPHNTFLSIIVDGGILGFAVFIVPLCVWLFRGMRRAATRPWAVAVFVGLVGGLAVSLDNFRPFWLAVGALAAYLTTLKSIERSKSTAPYYT